MLEKRVFLSAKVHQVWELTLAAAGRLKNLDLNNIDVPVAEVRSYLAAKYEGRFVLHPRKFEETVASVFADFGV